MRKNKLWALGLCAGLAVGMTMSAGAEEATEAPVEITEEAAEAAAQLTAPTDFTFDTATGDYSFNAVDENIGYYFIRIYKVENGQETGEYVASSKRMNGGKTGTFSGTVDLSEIAWGSYHVNLVSFAPAGTDMESPAPVTLTVQYGVDQALERPEMLVMASGNQAELVVDWWTLCDYNFRQYMPNMKFSFYSDAECTQEVMSDTVDLAELVDGLSKNPPGMVYIWGWSKVEGPHFYTAYNPDGDGSMFSPTEMTFAFKNDIYTYTLDPGTYYVTCQALAKDEYSKDSQISTPVEFTLTDGDVTEEYTFATTELWKDPQLLDMPGTNPGQQPDRVDSCVSQPLSGIILE